MDNKNNIIVHIGLNVNKGFSGRAIQINTIIEKLPDFEHKIISITGNSDNKSYRLKRIIECFNILKLLFKNKLNIIYHGWWFGAILIPILSLRHKIIFQSTSKNYDDYSTMKKGIKKIVLFRIDFFIEQSIPSNYNMTLKKLIYLPNICKVYSKTIKRIKNKCIHSGVISKRKNQIGAMQYFIKNKIEMNLDFYGPKKNNFDSSLEYIEKFNNLIDRNKNFNYKNEYTHYEIENILDKYTHFCVASFQEGMSNFYLECLSKGLEPIFIPNADKRLFESYNYKERDNFEFIFHNYPISMWEKLLKSNKNLCEEV